MLTTTMMRRLQLHGSGGFTVPPEMQELIDRPGFLPCDSGGDKLRILFRRNLANLDLELTSEFARRCFQGDLQGVKRAIENGTAPDILGSETPYQFGYVLFTVYGAQHMQRGPPGVVDHAGTLRYLLEQGAPPDLPDIVGHTALHHVCNVEPRPELARILLEGGANPDAQDRFGRVPLFGAFQNNSVATIDVLMEHGARLDVPDGDDNTPDEFYVKAGPHVTAAMQKWKRKRAGTTQPLDEKVCGKCGKSDSALKLCGKCNAIWYCSRECQRSDWPSHKQTCVGFDAETTVVVTPFYEDIGLMISPADVQRIRLGYPITKQSKRNTRSMHVPHIPPGVTKTMIVKIQVPISIDTGFPQIPPYGDMMVFDKKRSLVCRIRRQDGEEAYLRLAQVIHRKGVRSAKAYFRAEMTRTDELMIKITEVIAEQSF